jgi:hypothetical protein
MKKGGDYVPHPFGYRASMMALSSSTAQAATNGQMRGCSP